MKGGGCEEASETAAAAATGKEEEGGPLKKGPWTAAEDAILVEYVKKHGEGNWNAVQRNSGLARCGKSCRLRWANHLRPNLKKGAFTPEEELLILRLHAQMGNKWARMASQLPGRTDNEIKNYWNTRIKRRQKAGLPLYPPEVEVDIAFDTDVQLLPSPTAPISPPPTPKAADPRARFSAPTLPLLNPIGFPATSMPLLGQSPFAGPVPQSRGMKRLREDGLGFEFPLSPVSRSPPTTLYQPSSLSPSPPTTPLFQPPPPLLLSPQQSFEFNLGDFDASPPPTLSPFSEKIELPSTQLLPEPVAGSAGSNTGGSGLLSSSSGNSGLLDALLQEVHGAGKRQMNENSPAPVAGEQLVATFENLGGDDGNMDNTAAPPQFSVLESVSKLDGSDGSNGLNLENESVDAISPVRQDIATLFDMISAPTMPTTTVASDWNNSDSGEISNGQLSAATDDDFGLEMQHLTSSFSVAPMEQDWTLGSFSWSNNLPGIC